MCGVGTEARRGDPMETLIHFLCVMKLKRGGGPIDVQDTDGRAGSDQRDGRTWIVRASVKNDI